MPQAGAKTGLVVGCTIVLRKQLAHARVLATSFRRHHPGCEFSILVLDAPPGEPSSAPACETLHWHDLGLDPEEARRLPMLYDGNQLAAFAGPYLVRKLRGSGSKAVAFFTPELVLFAPLQPLATLSEGEAVIALSGQARGNGTESSLGDPAFVAIGPGADVFVESWISSARTQLGLPGAAASRLNHSPAVVDDENVFGFWNLEGCKLQRVGDHYEVDGRFLRAFAFSGYEPEKPHLLSKFLGVQPRILLSEQPVLLELCEEYRRELFAAGYGELQSATSTFTTLPGGVPIDHHMRSLYRAALERFAKRSGPEPPSPFRPGGESAFLKWLKEPVGVEIPTVTRYMTAIHAARADVRKAFPDPLGADAAAFRTWFATFGRAELGIPDALMPADLPYSATTAPAVNVAGFLRTELGIGEAARLLIAALEESEIPINTFAYEGSDNRHGHDFEARQTTQPADINIVCINPDQLPAFTAKMGPEFFAGKYTIGVWFWEVDEVPPSFDTAFNYVDEVWVASEFVRQAFLNISPKPVFKFHLPIVQPVTNPALTRADLGLPAAFTFLFSFDFLSVLERKNPLGVIEAFTQAFAPGEGPVLILKSINGDQRVREMEKLKFAARGRTDIQIMDGYLSAAEKNSMAAECDCYVSLHRSEGFGLTMAEAMALEKPVIATAFSGNLEFMTPQNSYLCSYAEREVGPDCEPYPPTAHWAEPDVLEASSLMRVVYENRDASTARGRVAAQEIAEFHSPKVAARTVADRIATIRRRRTRAASARSLDALEDRIEALERFQQRLLKSASQGGPAAIDDR